MKRQVHLVVLCEGDRDRRFLKAYLRQCGYNVDRNVRFQACAKLVGGAGDQSVRGRYAAELQYVRGYTAKNLSKTRWLLVHIDADMRTVQERYKELDDQLPQERRRTNKDAVCILVPKRHTETWVYYLLHASEAVSETDEYKSKVSDDQVVQAGYVLAVWDPRTDANCPPSLKLGYEELLRIPG